jgi:5-formyltetrahydrofolate cyclo-ligase
MKVHLRKELLLKRDRLTEKEMETKSRMIKKRLFGLKEFKNANLVLFYAAFRSEVKTEKMIKESIKSGKRIALPVVSKKGDRLLISELKDYDKELAPGYYNIPEQKEKYHRLKFLNEVDLVILPGVGFDEKGNRLGYGGGFYDRLLSETDHDITLIGLAYEVQITPRIHKSPHDVKVDKIVTEKRVIVPEKWI